MKNLQFIPLVTLCLVALSARADGDFFTPEAKSSVEQKVMKLLPSIERGQHLVLNADSLECVGSESMMGQAPVGVCLAEGFDDRVANSNGVFQVTLIDQEGANAKVVVTRITGEL